MSLKILFFKYENKYLYILFKNKMWEPITRFELNDNQQGELFPLIMILSCPHYLVWFPLHIFSPQERYLNRNNCHCWAANLTVYIRMCANTALSLTITNQKNTTQANYKAKKQKKKKTNTRTKTSKNTKMKTNTHTLTNYTKYSFFLKTKNQFFIALTPFPCTPFCSIPAFLTQKIEWSARLALISLGHPLETSFHETSLQTLKPSPFPVRLSAFSV